MRTLEQIREDIITNSFYLTNNLDNAVEVFEIRKKMNDLVDEYVNTSFTLRTGSSINQLFQNGI
jgi:hypothetical protein